MIAWNPVRSVPRMAHPPRGCRAGIGLLIVTAALLLTPGVAGAQGAAAGQPQDSRWWIGGGGGFIANRTDCTNCNSDEPYRSAGAVLFQGGLRVTERLLVGAEVLSAFRTSDAQDVRLTYLLALAQYRPFAAHGFFLKGGYGMALVKTVFPLEGVQVVGRSWGMGVMYGAGWMFRHGRRVSVAPVAGQYVATLGDIRTIGGTAENVVANGWFVGAVLTVR